MLSTAPHLSRSSTLQDVMRIVPAEEFQRPPLWRDAADRAVRAPSLAEGHTAAPDGR
jgi:hypothetical protein